MAVPDLLRDSIEKATPAALGENKRAVLFGTTDCADAADQISAFVGTALATRISGVLFVNMASACAAGLMLSDGRKVFLKIHAGELDLAELQGVHAAQEFMREKGVPAARLILRATPFRDGKFASVHAFRDRGDGLRAYHRGSIEAAAAAFSGLVEAGRSFSPPAAIPDLFATRKNPLFKRAPGIPDPPPLPAADRANAVATNVKEYARGISGPHVISHGDWASRNMRFTNGEVSSIFDFEALRSAVEPILVGHAAIQFINEPSGVREPPVATAYFITAYERAAGSVFEGDDAVALDAGVALAMSHFLRSVVRSEGMSDEDAPKIFENFMARFRFALGRDYTKNAFI